MVEVPVAAAFNPLWKCQSRGPLGATMLLFFRSLNEGRKTTTGKPNYDPVYNETSRSRRTASHAHLAFFVGRPISRGAREIHVPR